MLIILLPPHRNEIQKPEGVWRGWDNKGLSFSQAAESQATLLHRKTQPWRKRLMMVTRFSCGMQTISLDEKEQQQQKDLNRAWTEQSFWLTICVDEVCGESRTKSKWRWDETGCYSPPLLSLHKRAFSHTDWRGGECFHSLIRSQTLHPATGDLNLLQSAQRI